jgi:hypothetical protein
MGTGGKYSPLEGNQPTELNWKNQLTIKNLQAYVMFMT